jgi:hypothetical protein
MIYVFEESFLIGPSLVTSRNNNNNNNKKKKKKTRTVCVTKTISFGQVICSYPHCCVQP